MDGSYGESDRHERSPVICDLRSDLLMTVRTIELGTICCYTVLAVTVAFREYLSMAGFRKRKAETVERSEDLAYQACRRNERSQDRPDTSRRSDRDGTRTRSRSSRISVP